MKYSYKTNKKLTCRQKICKFVGIPNIKIIRFKNSKDFSVSAYCWKCNSYIENIPMQDVQVKKG